MALVVHIETRVTTLLGIQDDEGNIVQQLVVQTDPKAQNDPLLLRKLSKDGFINAHAAIAATRENIQKQVDEADAKSKAEAAKT